jgi:hypothetical protein
MCVFEYVLLRNLTFIHSEFFFVCGAILLKYYMPPDMFPFVSMDTDNSYPSLHS